MFYSYLDVPPNPRKLDRAISDRQTHIVRSKTYLFKPNGPVPSGILYDTRQRQYTHHRTTITHKELHEELDRIQIKRCHRTASFPIPIHKEETYVSNPHCPTLVLPNEPIVMGHIQ